MDLREIQSEIEARNVLLRQSQEAAIQHLEFVLGAVLAKLDAKARADVFAELETVETLTDDEKATVQLYSEIEPSVKSKRQTWREERAALEAQLAAAPDTGDNDPPDDDGGDD